MLVGAASFQHIPFAETEFLSKTQVCTGKLLSPYKFKVCRRKCTGLGTDPFVTVNPRAPPVSRAEFLSQKRESQNKKSKADRSLRDLYSLKETLRQHSQDEDLLSYNETQRQDLQGLKGIFNQQAEAPAKAAGLEQQRVPRAETNSNTRRGQAIPAHNQLDAQSKRPSSSASFGSRDAEKKPGNVLSVTRGKDAHPSKRRGSRSSARGLDVLDELMSSQGRRSRAVLENLQSAVAIENEDMPYVHPHERDTSVYPDTASPALSEFAEGKHGGIMSQMLSDFRRIDTRQPTYEATTDTAPTSSMFASSIEKALSPSKSLQIHSGTVSEVAKPSLRGQEVMWALQKAAIEKAKLKQKVRRVSDKASKFKEAASSYDSGEWRNAKPIVVKAEWALRIDELERRIESLKNPMPSS